MSPTASRSSARAGSCSCCHVDGLRAHAATRVEVTFAAPPPRRLRGSPGRRARAPGNRRLRARRRGRRARQGARALPRARDRQPRGRPRGHLPRLYRRGEARCCVTSSQDAPRRAAVARLVEPRADRMAAMMVSVYPDGSRQPGPERAGRELPGRAEGVHRLRRRPRLHVGARATSAASSSR